MVISDAQILQMFSIISYIAGYRNYTGYGGYTIEEIRNLRSEILRENDGEDNISLDADQILVMFSIVSYIGGMQEDYMTTFGGYSITEIKNLKNNIISNNKRENTIEVEIIGDADFEEENE